MIARRSFIIGLVSLVAAPAIVRAGSLMPVRVMVEPSLTAECLIDYVHRLINPPLAGGLFDPPYGIGPGLMSLQYLDEYNRITRRIIHEHEYLVDR